MLLECRNCEAMVDPEVLCTYEYKTQIEEYGELESRVTFAKCPACHAQLLADMALRIGSIVCVLGQS